MKMFQLKMNGLQWSEHFSHYKSMEIFPDAQGQLTPQSLVRSDRISRCYGCLIPARIKKIRSKIKALECSQDFPIITLWELSVAMETRVLIRSGPNLKPFPNPNDASVKI